MKQYFTFHKKQIIRKPIEEVFSFFQQPENLSRITPSSLDFQMLTPSPIVMQENALLDYSIRLIGFRIRWTTLITKYEPPYSFVDVQLKGPYSYWHHTHRFIETDDGTEMIDEIRYVIPFGFLGKLLHALFIKKELDTIFKHRSEFIQKFFNQTNSISTFKVQ